LVDNISYAQFSTAYLQLPTADYVISVTDATGATTVASYGAPLATLNLQGASAVALASGFLNPANNSNGPNFGIWVALPSGGDLLPLPVVTSLSSLNNEAGITIFPNPAQDKLMISSSAFSNERAIVNIYNQVGALVMTQQLTSSASNINTIEIENLANGFYTVEMLNSQNRFTAKFSVLK
jgi:hypothetical protein